MSIIKPIESINSIIPKIPIKHGQLITATDTKNIYLDTNAGDRIQIGDIIVLNEETDREMLLAPLPYKLYLIKETNKIYLFNGIEWIDLFKNNLSVQRFTYTITENSKCINLVGINNYNKEEDTIIVYINSVYLNEETDYYIENNKLYPADHTEWKASNSNNAIFNILLFSNISNKSLNNENFKPDTTSSIDGDRIIDNTITENKLDNTVKSKLNKISEMDNTSAINGDRIINSTISETKLDNNVIAKLNKTPEIDTTSSIEGDRIIDNSITENKLSIELAQKINSKSEGGGTSSSGGTNIKIASKTIPASSWFRSEYSIKSLFDSKKYIFMIKLDSTANEAQVKEWNRVGIVIDDNAKKLIAKIDSPMQNFPIKIIAIEQ